MASTIEKNGVGKIFEGTNRSISYYPVKKLILSKKILILNILPCTYYYVKFVKVELYMFLSMGTLRYRQSFI